MIARLTLWSRGRVRVAVVHWDYYGCHFGNVVEKVRESVTGRIARHIGDCNVERVSLSVGEVNICWNSNILDPVDNRVISRLRMCSGKFSQSSPTRSRPVIAVTASLNRKSSGICFETTATDRITNLASNGR